MATVVNNPPPERVVEVESSSSAGWAVAVIVLIVVVGGLLWWMRYYRAPAPAQPAQGGAASVQVTIPTPSGSDDGDTGGTPPAEE